MDGIRNGRFLLNARILPINGQTFGQGFSSSEDLRKLTQSTSQSSEVQHQRSGTGPLAVENSLHRPQHFHESLLVIKKLEVVRAWHSKQTTTT